MGVDALECSCPRISTKGPVCEGRARTNPSNRVNRHAAAAREQGETGNVGSEMNKTPTSPSGPYYDGFARYQSSSGSFSVAREQRREDNVSSEMDIG